MVTQESLLADLRREGRDPRVERMVRGRAVETARRLKARGLVTMRFSYAHRPPVWLVRLVEPGSG